jgi:hypothetical protein
MAVTRLKRKAKRNKSKSAARQASIKHLNAKPVIKSVDVEAIKAEFAGKSAPKKAKKEVAKDEEE